jgi:prepilin-type processing-associated H-X9-DG protein
MQAVANQIKTFQCPTTPTPDRIDPNFPPAPVPGVPIPATGPKWPAAMADYAAVAGISSNLWTATQGRPPVLTTPRTDTDGVFQGNANAGLRRVEEITDGTSNTLLLVESAGRPQIWRAGVMVPGSGEPGYTSTTGVTLSAWAAVNTFAFRGYTADGVTQPGPCAVNCSNYWAVYGFHTGGANVGFADGSVHFLRDSVAIDVFAALCTRAGGEVIPASGY